MASELRDVKRVSEKRATLVLGLSIWSKDGGHSKESGHRFLEQVLLLSEPG